MQGLSAGGGPFWIAKGVVTGAAAVDCGIGIAV